MTQFMHISVLEKEFLSFFHSRQVHTFVDGTLGAGGHSKALLDAHPEIELLIGFDQDGDALEIAKKTLAEYAHKVQFINKNFEELATWVTKPVDGLFFDLGVSSMQLDRDERGFSFMRDGPLDMRMNREAAVTAEEVVNSWSEADLGEIFRDLGEERKWRECAKAICQARRKKRIVTTKELADVVSTVVPRRGKIHPATLIFQGIRLAVNRELEVLRHVLHSATQLLAPGGRLGVISFHSLEDRIVKNSFRDDESVKVLTKKPLTATFEECKKNPRSRSAKLRFCEKQ
jgi:16S rRNA (cytosine1402-N4)-methyltransferase